MNPPARRVSRRSFVKNGLAGMMAAAVAPQFLTSCLSGPNAASNRVTLGCIGVGAHGFAVNLQSFLQQEDCVIRAVCDVWAPRREQGRTAVNQHYGNSDCVVFEDFREVLARRDLDAVVISTPDHWHVTMAMMALDAGKMVFCEKPTLTIEQG
ncbi:MAG: Gfo/Idh/MocA family oxidoreductase, partial [Opitutus sp.]